MNVNSEPIIRGLKSDIFGPLMANAIKNFHFDFLTTSLRVTEEELAMSNDMTLLLLKDPSSRVQSSFH